MTDQHPEAVRFLRNADAQSGHKFAALNHLGQAEYRIATSTDYDAIHAYAALAQARALLAIAEALSGTNDPEPDDTDDAGALRMGRRYTLTRDHLRAVVDVYRADTHAAPTRAVAVHFGVSHSTAAKWLGAARRQGLLEAAKWGAR